jgi:LuxR family maltose regulon positive regulatory protein
MNTSIPLENQLLATKFYVPAVLGPLISRPYLTALLEGSLHCPFTLVSAPAGFGKTTLLTTWKQSLPASKPLVGWISLDEDDNDPRLFWTYVLTTLKMQQPERFAPLVMQLQSPQPPSFKYILTRLINLLAEGTEEFLLILDDYQLITEQLIHMTLSYLIEHLPDQLHIIVATRVDPPLSIPALRVRKQALEIRADQLRCTTEETKAFFQEVVGIEFPNEAVQEIRDRTEGWLVGLRLLGLSLPERDNPLSLLEEVSGDQHYILDYLTEEVLQRQPQEVQTFLLCTSILDQLSASLCDAVMGQTGSQQMLQRLEQSNLFLVSLDNRRRWYRYHALFAEALRCRLEWTHPHLVLTLHHRASLWYAKHGRITQAILHAFSAREWNLAADLLERRPSLTSSWAMGLQEMAQLRQWLEQLPADIMSSRPRLCLAASHLLWTVLPSSTHGAWLDAAEATLRASLTQYENISHEALPLEVQQEQKKQCQELKDLLGEVIASHAFMLGFLEDRGAEVPHCLQALDSLSIDNGTVYVLAALARSQAFYFSSINNAPAAIQIGLQSIALAHTVGHTAFEILEIGTTAVYLLGAGQLQETYRLTQQAILLGTQPGGFVISEVSWPTFWQAEVLREWNQLDRLQESVEEALLLCHNSSIAVLIYMLYGYTLLLRIHLSRGDLEMARSAFQECERISTNMSQHVYLLGSSNFTIVDRVRFWLASGELDRARHWAKQLESEERRVVPFTRERQEVACARIHLATNQPNLALQRLEPVLERATAGKRWRHVIEIRLLQALAHAMQQEATQALDVLSQAVHLAEPEGYIRSFLDEGAPMERILSRLRKRERQHGPTPYLDKLLTAFEQERQTQRAAGVPAKASQPLELLSQRELEVLKLVAQGLSNQQIAQELVITTDTVKRHVRHILSKFGVRNRVQAANKAKELSIFDYNI